MQRFSMGQWWAFHGYLAAQHTLSHLRGLVWYSPFRFRRTNERPDPKMIGILERECVALDLPVSLAAVRRLGEGKVLSKRTEDELRDLRMRINGELNSRLFFAMEPGNAGLYAGKDLFGPEVAARFPSASDDIREAGKCLAFDRGTASVFHLMRVMERALYALGASLNDPALQPITTKNWDDILSRCRGQLKKDLKDREPEWRAHPEFYADCTDRLIAVKEAWRNPTMHIRPDGYSVEQAEEVFARVRSFMQRVATRLSEGPA